MSGPLARGAHLVERAAARLRAEAGLIDRAPWSAEDAALDPAPAETPVPPPPDAVAPPDVTVAPEPPAPPEAPANGASADATPAAPPAAATPAAPPAAAPPAAAPPADAAGAALPVLDLATLVRAGLVLSSGRSRVAEEYRITVGRALRALRGSRGGRTGTANLLMVTSARPGEGKSFSALNIAASIAQNGLADVLLVDIDSKPRSLSALLGLGGREGLLDLAAGWIAGSAPAAAGNAVRNPETLLARTGIEGLSFLPVGLRRPGVEGAVTRSVSVVLERLGRRFPRHVIVLDTAPCLSTSDPSTLAGIVDEVLLVVEAERTQRSEVEAALELLRAASNITLVLNKVRLTQRHSFGSYYYFDEPA
jgi:protein-tyrosine kinase